MSGRFALAKQLRADLVLASLTDALAQTGRLALVPPRFTADFFATVAFTFPDATTGERAPVLIEIDPYLFGNGNTPSTTEFALAIAAVAGALSLCPTVTGADGYHALARISRAADLESVESVESPHAAQRGDEHSLGVAITYNFGYASTTTLFLTLDAIAASDRASLADRIIRCAPRHAEPGFATPERRRATDEERAEYVHLMCLAPDSKHAAKRAKRTLTL